MSEHGRLVFLFFSLLISSIISSEHCNTHCISISIFLLIILRGFLFTFLHWALGPLDGILVLLSFTVVFDGLFGLN